ncbi:MAG: hypothetical protein HY748_01545 [Elusimicrobia bacterium]|nr:hypothetical protein [Elusimicrobiota bacterium]
MNDRRDGTRIRLPASAVAAGLLAILSPGPASAGPRDEAFAQELGRVQGAVREAAPIGESSKALAAGFWDWLFPKKESVTASPGTVRVTKDVALTDVGGAAVVLKANARPEPTDDSEPPVIPGVTFPEDGKLCGKPTEFPLILEQTRLVVDAATIASRLVSTPAPRQLTPEEKATLNRMPACEPFLGFLHSVSRLLKDDGTPPLPEDPSGKLTEIVLANSKDLKTGVLGLKVGDKLAYFRLGRKLEFDNDGDMCFVGDLAAPADKTGQGVGAAISGTMGETRKSHYTTKESCSGTSVRRVCRDGRCHDVSVTWYGKREARYEGAYRSDEYRLKLTGPDQAVLGELDFTLFDHDDGTRSYGPCIEESFDRRD